eukprot:730510-Pyramimonas_sp.AAC.1
MIWNIWSLALFCCPWSKLSLADGLAVCKIGTVRPWGPRRVRTFVRALLAGSGPWSGSLRLGKH